MTPAEQLRAAKALIDTPGKWIKGDYARDSKGRSCLTGSDTAACFCSRGALKAATGQFSNGPLERVVPRGFRSLVDFNDHKGTTHADIMKVFDDAIALAEAGQ